MRKTLRCGKLRFQVESSLVIRPAPDKGVDWPILDDMPGVRVTFRLPTNPENGGGLPYELTRAWGFRDFKGCNLYSNWGSLDHTGKWREFSLDYRVESVEKAGVREAQKCLLDAGVADVAALIGAVRARRARLRSRGRAIRKFPELRGREREGSNA